MSRPSGWDDVAYSLRRHYVDAFFERAMARLPQQARVLDIGGYRSGQRGRFDLARFPVRAVSVNISVAKRPAVQGDATRLPFADASFDAAICSEVLEHILDPRVVLAETHRVLEGDALLLICAPFLYQIHGDPDDFGRYTASYWHRSLSDAGFRVDRVERQGAFWSVLVDMLRAYACDSGGRSLGPRLARRALRLVMPVAKRVAVHQDERASPDPFLARFTTGFGIVAVKDRAAVPASP